MKNLFWYFERHLKWNDEFYKDYKSKLTGIDHNGKCEFGPDEEEQCFKEKLLEFFNSKNPTLKLIQEINFLNKHMIFQSGQSKRLYSVFRENVNKLYFNI